MPDAVLEYLDYLEKYVKEHQVWGRKDHQLVQLDLPKLCKMLRYAVTCLEVCFPDYTDAVLELERLNRMAKEASE